MFVGPPRLLRPEWERTGRRLCGKEEGIARMYRLIRVGLGGGGLSRVVEHHPKW